MGKSLKQKAISGMLWNSVQRFGTMGISFVSNLVLARLLAPEDFGCIGMLTFFIAVSDAFISGGFGVALIQKKNPTREDYSTIFYWNIMIAVVFIIALYFAAPFVASFYKIPLLCDILRVQSFILLINSFSIVQNNRLVKQLDFKKLTYRTLIATTIGTGIGILLAYRGWGVWTLVVKSLVTGLVGTILIWRIAKWKPSFIFSWTSFKGLFQFGSLMFLSNMIDTVYANLQTLIIGRFFSVRDLGYFTHAKRMGAIPTQSLSVIVNRVTFPLFSKIQSDTVRLKKIVKQNMKAITFLNFPLCVLLIVIARPLFTFLFTSKWNESVLYFQLFCISGMIFTVNTININICKSLGKGKLYFYTLLIKRAIGLISILLGLKFGIIGMTVTIVTTAYIYFFINAAVSGRLINYGVLEQIKDIAPCFALAVGVGVVTCFVEAGMHSLPCYLGLIIQTAVYGGSFLGLAYLFNLEEFRIYFNVLKGREQGL